MTPIQTVLAVYVVQQAIFALLWLLAARLGLARRTALHWGAGTTLLTAAMAIVLLRPLLPPAWGAAVPNLLSLAGLWLLGRGLRRFLRVAPADATTLAVVGGAAVFVVAAVALGLGHAWVVLATAAGVAGTIGLTIRDGGAPLKAEFGRTTAVVCSLPLLMLSAVVLVRAGVALSGGGTPSIDRGSPLEVGVVLALFGLATTIHFAMAALVVLRLVARLRHLSQHDALTGLLNRRAWGQRLAAERGRQRRRGAPLALLSLDIDHFKAVNDRHGHAAGDRVLVAVAAALRREARGTDAVARLGGEEFALLLPDTDAEGARHLGERLLAAIRALAVEHEGQRLAVTASIGLAMAAREESDDTLQRRLDRALYAAKHGGRNRLVPAAAVAASDAAGRVV